MRLFFGRAAGRLRLAVARCPANRALLSIQKMPLAGFRARVYMLAQASIVTAIIVHTQDGELP
jgi:hypothetical protein